MGDNVSHVQGPAQPLVIIHHSNVSAASLSKGTLTPLSFHVIAITVTFHLLAISVQCRMKVIGCIPYSSCEVSNGETQKTRM